MKTTMSEACPDDNELALFVERQLSEPRRAELEDHLVGCEPCSDTVNYLVGAFASEASTPRHTIGRHALPRTGDRLGRYVILDAVGAGAMGAVYSAFDPELDRKVALKVLPPQRREGGEQLRARFLTEARAMANLSHRNVISVYDVGQEGEFAFFTMELIDGQTLTQWSAAAHSVAEVIEVFAAAGRGLAAAHSSGLVHRDFKPDNALIGNDGGVHVIDFGLARFTTPSMDTPSGEDEPADPDTDLRTSTRTGSLLGTPAYMAPEQLAGEPSGAPADQFAFCVSLFEALHGHRPFSGGNVGALSEAIDSGPDQQSSRAVPRRVRRVLTRGLSVQPSDRYPSMDALVAALTARTFSRWAPVVLIALAAVVWAAAPSTAETCAGGEARTQEVWGADRQTRIREAFDRSTAAGASKDGVLSALELFVADWEVEHRRVCESAQRGERSDTSLDAAMACLDRSIVEFDAFCGLLEEADPDALIAAAVGSSSLSRATACGQTHQLGGPAPPAESNAEAVRLVDADLARVRGLLAAGAYDLSLERGANAVKRSVEIGYLPLEARAQLSLGRALVERGTPADAAETLEAALWAGHRSDELDVPARASIELAKVLVKSLDRPDAGLRVFAYAEAEVERRGLDELRPNIERLRADFHRRERDDDAVLASHERAIELLGAGTPLRRADYLSSFASDLSLLGRFDESAELLDEALVILAAEVGDTHPMYAKALGRLGLVRRSQGEMEQAREDFERALEIQQAARGPRHEVVVMQRRRLADLDWKTGAIPEAIEGYERIVELDRALYEAPNRRLAMDLTELASLYTIAFRRQEAEETFEMSVSAYGSDAPPDMLADTHCKYGALLFLRERPDEAAAEVEDGLALVEELESAVGLSALTQCLRTRAMIATETGDTSVAVEMAERSYAANKARYGATHGSLARELLFVADAYKAAGNLERAADRLEHAAELASPGTQARLLAMIEVDLAKLRLRQGRQSDARALAQSGLQRTKDAGDPAKLVRRDARDVLTNTE